VVSAPTGLGLKIETVLQVDPQDVVDPQLPLHELDPQLEQLFSEQLFVEQLLVEQLVSQVLAQLPQSAVIAGISNKLIVKKDLKRCFIALLLYVV